MRIRRRPHPPLQILTDPSLQVPASNGRDEPRVDGRERGGWGRGLHPDGYLSTGPHGVWRRDPALTQFLQHTNPSDPHPTIGIPSPPVSHLNGCCIPPPHATDVQTLREYVEEKELQVDLHKTRNARVNSNKRFSGTSGSCDGKKELPPKKPSTTKAKVTTAPQATATQAYNSMEISSTDKFAVKEEKNGVGNGTKKRRSPAVLMEGSRCSRVNGRGWRCCQPTLVGYSLCEHHLGKGRLRSVSSVRVQVGGSKFKKEQDQEQETKQEQQLLRADDDGRNEELEKLADGKKKIGVVKARSISSLLDDNNHAATTTTMLPLDAGEAMVPTNANA